MIVYLETIIMFDKHLGRWVLDKFKLISLEPGRDWERRRKFLSGYCHLGFPIMGHFIWWLENIFKANVAALTNFIITATRIDRHRSPGSVVMWVDQRSSISKFESQCWILYGSFFIFICACLATTTAYIGHTMQEFFYACSRFLRLLLGRQRTLEHTGLLFNYCLETVIIFDKRLGWRVVKKIWANLFGAR